MENKYSMDNEYSIDNEDSIDNKYSEVILLDKFVGRTAEMKFLEQHYAMEGSQLLVVYGDRGVGKTRLLKEFCKGKKSAYYLARACSAREQLAQWSAELKEAGVELARFPEWAELLPAVLPQTAGKQVLVIDEFHHTVKGDAGAFEALVRFVEDRLLSRPIMIVLVTSASGWVENSMVGKLGAKAASIAGFLKLRELPFKCMRELFPEYGMEDALGCYAVLGGVPDYWNCFSEKYGARENIIRNVLSKNSRLYGALTVFMEQELREPGVYNTILASMATGCNKLNDIYRHTGFSRAKISVYLKNLMELDLVEKVYSYETAGRGNMQKGVYRILGSYVRFYFKYIFPNQSALEQLTPEEFYSAKVEDSFALFAEEAYRAACREDVAREYKNAGEWLGKTGSLDIVASDGQGRLCVAACCYARKMAYGDYEWLLFSMKKARIKQCSVRLYCERGFDGALMEAAEKGKLRLMRIGD